MKVCSIDEALSHIHDGITLMYGGFGGIGSPPTLIDAILEKGVKNLVLIGNDAGFPDIGIGRLVSNGRARKLIVSHIGSNPSAGQQMSDRKVEVEFYPQGTLAEKIRAGGVGIGGILVDIGIDSMVGEGKEQVWVDGKQYLIEPALTADVSIVLVKQADPFGNLVYNKSARNTNPLVAMAGNFTIAEAEEIVDLGELDPDMIITPGVFVDKVVPSEGVNWKWVWE